MKTESERSARQRKQVRSARTKKPAGEGAGRDLNDYKGAGLVIYTTFERRCRLPRNSSTTTATRRQKDAGKEGGSSRITSVLSPLLSRSAAIRASVAYLRARALSQRCLVPELLLSFASRSRSSCPTHVAARDYPPTVHFCHTLFTMIC